MSGEPVCFVVDVTALCGLRDALVRLRSELGQFDYGNVVLSPGQAGDEAVAGGVEQFVKNWRDGRSRIEERLDDCVILVASAVEQYSTAEKSVQTAAQPTGGGAG